MDAIYNFPGLIGLAITLGFFYWMAVSGSEKYGPFICALLFGGFQIGQVLLNGGSSKNFMALGLTTVFVYGMLKLLNRIAGGPLWWLLFVVMCAGDIAAKIFFGGLE